MSSRTTKADAKALRWPRLQAVPHKTTRFICTFQLGGGRIQGQATAVAHRCCPRELSQGATLEVVLNGSCYNRSWSSLALLYFEGHAADALLCLVLSPLGVSSRFIPSMRSDTGGHTDCAIRRHATRRFKTPVRGQLLCPIISLPTRSHDSRS